MPAFDAGSGLLRLAWTAEDPDGDPVFFTVQFSRDGGMSWQALKINGVDPALAISTMQLPGGIHCRLKVIATDGFHTVV